MPEWLFLGVFIGVGVLYLWLAVKDIARRRRKPAQHAERRTGWRQ